MIFSSCTRKELKERWGIAEAKINALESDGWMDG
jgi:hypothetical protein